MMEKEKITCPECNGSGMGDTWYHQDENGNYEAETTWCECCGGFGFYYDDEEEQ